MFLFFIFQEKSPMNKTTLALVSSLFIVLQLQGFEEMFDVMPSKMCPFFATYAIEDFNEGEKKLLSAIEIGAIYEHYSGKQYAVVGVFRGSEDLQIYVAYVSLYEDLTGYGSHWVRSLAMFTENVIVDGVKQSRFRKISA